MIIIPKIVPIIVGQDVPASGSCGAGDAVGPCAIAVDVAVGPGVWLTGVGDGVAVGAAVAQAQSVSAKHCAFLQFPAVSPDAM
jgi:hypothetical protein